MMEIGDNTFSKSLPVGVIKTCMYTALFTVGAINLNKK